MHTDSEILEFIHARLEHVYGENPLFDYMQNLRRIETELRKKEKKRARSRQA